MSWKTILFAGAILFSVLANAEKPELISINDAGTSSGDNWSALGPAGRAFSTDRRFVVFASPASDLVPVGMDTNGTSDIFVRDTLTGTTTLVSVNEAGTSSGDSGSDHPVLSADGRFVAFNSGATDLVPTGVDTNGRTDVFVRDLISGTTTLVSVNHAGASSGSSDSYLAELSADGRFAVFHSSASNLVPTGIDTNGTKDVFVRDLLTMTTTLVSVNDAGTSSGDGYSNTVGHVLSADGRFVAFNSGATDLVPTGVDTNGRTDVFVRDLISGTTTLVSVNHAGTFTGHDGAEQPVLSADGRFVAFQSYSWDLVPAGMVSPGTSNIFVRDLLTETTTLVSTNNAGNFAGNGQSFHPMLTTNGRFVAFTSYASDLVLAGIDTNGRRDIFVRDLISGTTTLVSVNHAGTSSDEADSWFLYRLLSADGRFVVFQSWASDLVPAGIDTNGTGDVFVRDLLTETTTLVSVNHTGTTSGNSYSTSPAVSADGRFVAFVSSASDLLATGMDTNGARDVFVVKLTSSETPAGENIVVNPPPVADNGDPVEDAPDISFTFGDIEEGGETTVVVTDPSSGGASTPSGFRIMGLTGAPVLFDIETTATLAEGSSFVVCFDYSGMNVAGNPDNVNLAHEVDGVWVDITTDNDTVDFIICGEADSFSYFALLESLEIVGPTDPIALGTEAVVGIDVGDPNLTDTVHWEWGDGSPNTDVAATTNDVVAAHTYAEAGVYTVTATLLLAGVEAGSADFQYVVVYDPTAGFVTGGGWFNSPVGAYFADSGLVGKANFGFVSKYKKGAIIPTGTTEFQFKAGYLNFRSLEYQWLVIAGSRAQFKGVGTINGVGNFGFMLTAVDEALTPSTDVDLFRIKIWDTDNADAVVYDNGLGDADDGDAATVIGGGSIVIHKPKK